jgi:hypothetical protein
MLGYDDRMTEPAANPPAGDDLGDRIKDRMETFGREAEAAGKRLGEDPTLVGAADTATRIWGAILIAIGLWFLADQTFGLAMPAIPWREAWPLGLIVLGLIVIVRGMSRRAR